MSTAGESGLRIVIATYAAGRRIAALDGMPASGCIPRGKMTVLLANAETRMRPGIRQYVVRSRLIIPPITNAIEVRHAVVTASDGFTIDDAGA
jgi:hypothetical protein